MIRNYLDILAETISSNWEAPALTEFYLTEDGTAQNTTRGKYYTYGEMYTEICRVAELLTSLGLQKGDHIAICGANSTSWIIAYLAIAKIQGVAVIVMHTLLLDEIARLIAFSDAKALFTDENIWAELKNLSMPQVKNVVGLEGGKILMGDNHKLSSIKYQVSTKKISFPQSSPDDLAMICFTSGTAQNSKGVMLSQLSLSINVSFEYDLLAKHQGNSSVIFLPLYHIYGVMGELLRPICAGTHIHILKEVYSPVQLLNCYKLIKPAFLTVVPMMINNLTKVFSKAKDPSSSAEMVKNLFGENIDIITIGGAALSKEVEESLLFQGSPFVPSYGMTECGPGIARTKRNDFRSGSVGRVVPAMTARISPEGEILVKGENVMLGYYKDPEATAQKIDKEGWLHTGDAGYMDEDGYLYVTGRMGQDMIVLPNGENIHPEDIENKINALPEVKESIVVARDGKLVAMVVLEQGARSKEQRPAILRTVNPQLPLYSQLYDVEFIDKPLERTAKQTIKRYLYK